MSPASQSGSRQASNTGAGKTRIDEFIYIQCFLSHSLAGKSLPEPVSYPSYFLFKFEARGETGKTQGGGGGGGGELL